MTRPYSAIRLLPLLGLMMDAPVLAATAYLHIDGRYYLIDQVSDAIQYDSASSLWEIKAAAMANCRRGNGLPPSLGSQGFIALPSFTVVYTNTSDIVIDHTDPVVISLSTPSGDVICDGAVTGPPPPPPPPPAVLFANHFE